MSPSPKKRLDEILVAEGLASDTQIREALMRQKARGGKLGSHLLYHRYVDEAGLVKALAIQFACEGVVLANLDIPDSILELIPKKIALARRVLPVAFDGATQTVTVACEEDGTPYLTIRVPMEGSPREFDTTSYLYTRLEGKLLRSETNFRATFNVNKHMGLLFKKNVKVGRRFIEIGNTRSADILRELEIEEHPFQTRYAEHMSSCFDLPEKNVPAWLESLNR